MSTTFNISDEMTSLIARMKLVHSFVAALGCDSGLQHDDETFDGLATVTGSMLDDMKRLREAATEGAR